MKKIIYLIIFLILFVLCYGYNEKNYPNEYYNVYLDEEYLGMILSKEKLEKYIDEKTEHVINTKEVTKTYCSNEKSLDEIIESLNLQEVIDKSVTTKYYKNNQKDCVDITVNDGYTIEKIYRPNGLKIEKVLTYENNLSTIEEIYSKIVQLKSFTVKGYQYTFTHDDETKYIYTINKDILKSAIEEVIITYVGKENYNNYLNDSQEEIKTTGSIFQNIYLEDDITFKEVQIAIDEKIYTNANELAQFLLYGNNPISKKYEVKENEMITDIAMKNEISTNEFIISNPKYKNEDSLIAVGTEVSIKQTDPQINVVVEKYVVEDKEKEFQTIYQYDDNKYIGYTEVIQKGEKGLERVSQSVKIVNGQTVYVDPKGKEELKASVDKIVIKGDKYVPNVGDISNWAWPTESGWTSTSGYEWRIHPITGIRHFHHGLDIGGTGYNSAVYAANNGTIITMTKDTYGFGNYIVINHNNGYYTLYAHMNKFYEGLSVGSTVIRGQQIGYVGSTGSSTGPHLHLEVWKNCQYCRINPWSIYR